MGGEKKWEGRKIEKLEGKCVQRLSEKFREIFNSLKERTKMSSSSRIENHCICRNLQTQVSMGGKRKCSGVLFSQAKLEERNLRKKLSYLLFDSRRPKTDMQSLRQRDKNMTLYWALQFSFEKQHYCVTKIVWRTTHHNTLCCAKDGRTFIYSIFEWQ